MRSPILKVNGLKISGLERMESAVSCPRAKPQSQPRDKGRLTLTSILRDFHAVRVRSSVVINFGVRFAKVEAAERVCKRVGVLIVRIFTEEKK